MTHRFHPRRTIRRLVEDLHIKVNHITRKVEEIMAGQQEALDAIVARIDTATADIRQDIADLKAANPSVDFSALEEKVAGLEGLDAENPAPEPPPL